MQHSVRASLEQFTLAHPGGGEPLKISVAAPAMLPPDGPVSVLYVVDANLIFGIAAEIARAMPMVGAFPACYVVGIGYDATYVDFLKLRTADLSPPVKDEARAKMGELGAMIGSERNGGADVFLAFMADTLRREITARYPHTEGGSQMLFGHSLGGLFAAHALLTRADAFSSFLISSPSLWWDDFSIFEKLPSFRKQLATLPARPRVFVNVGGREQDIPESVPAGTNLSLKEVEAHILASRMVDAAKEFADALGDAGLPEMRHIAFPHDDHLSVVPTAIQHGLRFALTGV
jgi:predicted alpha/beta superfamily hydrolase